VSRLGMRVQAAVDALRIDRKPVLE
jgi:hypothetical protein